MRRAILIMVTLMVMLSGSVLAQTPNQSPKDLGRPKINPITVNSIGTVRHQGERTIIDLLPELAPALEGLADFSHVWVLYWFHEQDRPEERRTLKVHPRRDPANPLTGVFATRAPVRPNLIGLCACRVLKVSGHVLEVSGLDARDGSPVLDLKPYIPQNDSLPGALYPEWVQRIMDQKKETPAR
jgi:tRNA-Thr(GGU) m(6)t(6)A37 methyltransferase TsaA